MTLRERSERVKEQDEGQTGSSPPPGHFTGQRGLQLYTALTGGGGFRGLSKSSLTYLQNA